MSLRSKLGARSKATLSRVLPNSTRWRFLAALPQLRDWIASHPESYPTFQTRNELYQHLQDTYLSDTPLDFIEFGTYKGESLLKWAELHQTRTSRFFGFDTFTGLPEAWHGGDAGRFTAENQLPQTSDQRISFEAGLFQDTLPSFLASYQAQSQLVVHMDADIYSATLYALTRMHDYLVPGTIIIFDEFSSVLHEFRALTDYCNAYYQEYEILGATKSPTLHYVHVAIRIK